MKRPTKNIVCVRLNYFQGFKGRSIYEGGINMANKEQQGTKNNKKVATKTLKEKRAEKKEKKK